jgi:hypothetical protein
LIEVTATDADPPAELCMNIVMRALRPLLLPIRATGDLVPIMAGQLLELNDAAFEEGELLGGAVLALVSVGALELVRDGALN